MKPSAFDIFHPIVPALYFLAVICFSMLVFHPVPLAITVLAGFLYSAYQRGWRAALKTAVWQVPLFLIVALVNPLLNQSGSTILFRMGTGAFFLESFAYGACMAAMLLSVLLWFSCASHVITSDKVMMLTGNVAPTIGLMITMIARLIPQFLRRGADIAAAQSMNPAAGAGGGKRLAGTMRQFSVLMGWSMEDSLETSEAMMARGWGAAPRRSTYARYRFRRRDGLALAMMGALFAACIVCAAAACRDFGFYPAIEPFTPWWMHLPYAVFAFLPLLMEGIGALRWKLR